MRLSVCFSIVVVAVALAKASPVAKAAEKKSLVEDAKLESKAEDLKIEDTGSDKDRAKKSASFCVDIKSASSQPVQAPCNGNQQTVQEPNSAVQSQAVAQSVQYNNVVPASYAQPSFNVQPSYIQSYNLQPSYASAASQANVVLPYQSFSLPQPSSQPCAVHAPSVNIVPSVPQTKVVSQASVESVNAKADAAVVEELPKEQPKPERIEEAVEPLPAPQETLATLPTVSYYHEHLFPLSSSPMVMYPELEQMPITNVLQGPSTVVPNNMLTPCPCQNSMGMFSEAAVEPMEALPYSSVVVGSPTMVPHNGAMHILTHEHGLSPLQARHRHTHIHDHSHAVVNVNNALAQSSIRRANPYVVQNLPYSRTGQKMSFGTYPVTYRVASPIVAGSLRNAENAENSPLAFEVNDLTQSNKMPREVNSSAKMEEVKQQADDSEKSIEKEIKM